MIHFYCSTSLPRLLDRIFLVEIVQSNFVMKMRLHPVKLSNFDEILSEPTRELLFGIPGEPCQRRGKDSAKSEQTAQVYSVFPLWPGINLIRFAFTYLCVNKS